MQVFVTRYALTTGIFVMDAKPIENWKYASQIAPMSGCRGLFLSRNDFALDFNTALDQAEKKRAARIKTLRKALKKVESVVFKDPTLPEPQAEGGEQCSKSS